MCGACVDKYLKSVTIIGSTFTLVEYGRKSGIIPITAFRTTLTPQKMHEEITFDEFISRFAPVKDYLPLDFSYEKEDKCFYIDLVVLWRLMDAFILHPGLRSFVKVTAETPLQYQAIIEFLKTGRNHVVKYLDEHLEGCQEEGF